MITKNNKMKKIYSLFIAVFAFSAVAFAQSNIDTLVVKTNIYCNHCKQCESCGGKIEKELFFNKGIKSILLDEKAMTITVAYSKKHITPDEIRTAISKLGYDADTVKADPSAYKALDGCCKKPD